MSKVLICVNVSERLLRGFEDEARRRGVEVEHLLEHTVETLLTEMEEEEGQAPDASYVVS
jgi:hypothetical protein